jgi:serine phosphatase RsbU (regulator of sigma subunit)
MARICNALRGLSATELSCAGMLGALNQLVCETEDPETIASAITGTLDPERPMLEWAQAGHPPPVLIRDDAPMLLSRPRGLMLGTVPDAAYEQEPTELLGGDLLLWYTDGLIEHRERSIDEGISRLLDAAAGCTAMSAEGFLGDLARRLAPLTAGDDICMLAVRVRLELCK